MRILSDDKLIQRNVTISKYATGGGLALLIGAFILNIYALSKPEDVQLIAYVFGAFILGFTLTNIGTFFSNRWGRRPDLGLAEALKTLDERYTLYNYRLGASHVLVGPNGVTVLLPKYQLGVVAYLNDKWVHPTGRRGLAGMFNNDGLGNPAAEAAGEVEALNNFLKRRAPEVNVAPQATIVFMSPRAEVSAKDSPVAALHFKQLKDYVKRQPKVAPPLMPVFAELEGKLGLEPST